MLKFFFVVCLNFLSITVLASSMCANVLATSEGNFTLNIVREKIDNWLSGIDTLAAAERVLYIDSLYPLDSFVQWKLADYPYQGHAAVPYTGVFNPVKGIVEWKRAEHPHVDSVLPYFGVFNPITKTVEWKLADYPYQGHAAVPYTGVFNPVKGIVEWKRAEHPHVDSVRPYFGVFNPITKTVEWKLADYPYQGHAAVPYTGVLAPR